MRGKRFSASFRDPAGYVFERDGRIFRQILTAGTADHELFVKSGLAEKLLKDNTVIPFHEISRNEGGITL